MVTFTSSSTVVNFVRAFPDDKLPAVLGDALVACMGPVTADTARKLGLKVEIIAREYTTHGLAAGDRRRGRAGDAKSRALARQRRPPAALAVEPEDDVMLPETWRKRPWIPYLIMVAVLAVVLGTGFAMNKALQPVGAAAARRLQDRDRPRAARVHRPPADLHPAQQDLHGDRWTRRRARSSSSCSRRSHR